jgi:hypothetical protein
VLRLLSAALQLRLVLEMADLGNLKEFLGRGGFALPGGCGQRNMAAIVATALDIARAMLHLHTENIIHSDLKVGCANNAVSLMRRVDSSRSNSCHLYNNHSISWAAQTSECLLCDHCLPCAATELCVWRALCLHSI